MITSKKLIKHKNISHGFFNRIGGKSSGIYKSLNCGPGSNDKKNKIKKNLKIVKNKISKKSKNIFLLHQAHSNRFVFIKKNSTLNFGNSGTLARLLLGILSTTPNIEVKLATEDLKAYYDPSKYSYESDEQLQKAIQTLLDQL